MQKPANVCFWSQDSRSREGWRSWVSWLERQKSFFNLYMQLLMIHNICSIFSCWLHRLLREPLVMKGKMLVLASDKVETMTISFKPISTLFCLRPFSSPPTTTSEGQDASVLKLLPALAHQHFVCQEESFSCKKMLTNKAILTRNMDLDWVF